MYRRLTPCLFPYFREAVLIYSPNRQIRVPSWRGADSISGMQFHFSEVHRILAAAVRPRQR